SPCGPPRFASWTGGRERCGFLSPPGRGRRFAGRWRRPAAASRRSGSSRWTTARSSRGGPCRSGSSASAGPAIRLLGLRLLQQLTLVGTPRRSAVAEVDASGSLVRLDLAGDDDEVLGALGPGPALLVVDAPLLVANEGGRRDVETLLAWCDVPLF